MTVREAWQIGLRKARTWAYGSPSPVVFGSGAEIAVIAIAAVAAAASTYMAYSAQEDAAKDQAKMAKLQAENERAAGESARRQKELQARRMLNAQASKAGKAGVVAGEGSLLENQLEAASLAEYDAQLAQYGHQLQSGVFDYQRKLFKNQANRLGSQKLLATGLSAASSAGSAYGKTGGGSGSTLSTGYDSASLNAQSYGYL